MMMMLSLLLFVVAAAVVVAVVIVVVVIVVVVSVVRRHELYITKKQHTSPNSSLNYYAVRLLMSLQESRYGQNQDPMCAVF